MNELHRILEQEMLARGPIPFSRYMELCLYHPELGYYSRHAGQFGKAGDFYTSSDVHAVFGRLLARQLDEMWRVLGSPATIVLRELGPGRGLFAQDVLDWSQKKFPEFFHALRYELVEQSPALKQRMERTLRQHLESGKAEFANIDRLNAHSTSTTGVSTTGKSKTLVVPNPGLPGAALAAEVPVLFFANEFFDAIPVEIVSAKGTLRIDTRNGQFVEIWVPASEEELQFIDRYSIHPEEGERVEVSLQAQKYMEITAQLDRGFVIIVDYGYTRDEQLAGRHRGTLKAIHQHSVSANPYEAPGEQDITADVNFTAVAAAAERQGMHAQKLVTQSQFLMGIGEANQFADAFEECRLPQERAKAALHLKHLVTPAGMGESFHVLVASKDVQAEKVSRLSGLGFGRR